MMSVIRNHPWRNRQRSGSASLSVCATIVALGVSACGMSTSDVPAGGAGSSDGDSGALREAGASDEVGTMHAAPFACTTPHTICVDMKVPADLAETPARLVFNIYDSPGEPAHPPNGYAGVFNAPTLTAGDTVHFELSDDTVQGDYWLFAIMYMPGGGFGPPVLGVDYIMRSAPAVLHLDGTPLNLTAPVVIGK
jgi:hypothetical protein